MSQKIPPLTEQELKGGSVPDEILQIAFGIPEIPAEMKLYPERYCMRCRTLLPQFEPRLCAPFKGGNAMCRNRRGDRVY
jgi:hypothetical protein